MHFTDKQRQQLKYDHGQYLHYNRFHDKFADLLASIPIYTGYYNPHLVSYGHIHITQRNVLILLHKLGVRP